MIFVLYILKATDVYYIHKIHSMNIDYLGYIVCIKFVEIKFIYLTLQVVMLSDEPMVSNKMF